MRAPEFTSKMPTLRNWQYECIQIANKDGWFVAGSDKPNYAINVAPGGGKTIFGVTSWLRMKESGCCQKMVVVVPSRNLKRQWQRQCQQHGIRLAAENLYDLGDPSINGCVITYAAVCSSPNTLKAVCRDAGIDMASIFLVCDEYHRVSQDKVTGGKLELAFNSVGKRLVMSGTFFRTDGRPMPWVEYDETGYPVTDYVYSMPDAIADKVLRTPEFLYLDGDAKFVTVSPEESETDEIKFSEAEDLSDESKIIESLIGDRKNLFTYLHRAVEQLRSCQQVNPDDRGGIVVSTVEQANKVQQALLELGVSSTVVTTPGEQGDSDDGDLSLERDRESAKLDNDRLLDEFRSGRGGDFIISVAMLREGTDLPNWRVMVYLSRCRSLLSFMQFIARCMRIRCQCTNPNKHGNGCDFEIGARTAYIFVPRTPTFIGRARELDLATGMAIREKTLKPEGPRIGAPATEFETKNFRVLDESSSEFIYSSVRNSIELTTREVSVVIEFTNEVDRLDPEKSLGSKMRGKHGHDELLLILKAARGHESDTDAYEYPASDDAPFIPTMSPEAERKECNRQFNTISNRIGHLLCEQLGISKDKPNYPECHAEFRNRTIFKIHRILGVSKWEAAKQPLSMLKKRVEVSLAHEQDVRNRKVS